MAAVDGSGLKANPTLPEIQSFVARKMQERGFDNQSVQDHLLLLMEEVGELAKSVRPLHGMKLAEDSKAQNTEHEAADVFWMLVCVCNNLGIDLEQAVREKEAINAKRVWR